MYAAFFGAFRRNTTRSLSPGLIGSGLVLSEIVAHPSGTSNFKALMTNRSFDPLLKFTATRNSSPGETMVNASASLGITPLGSARGTTVADRVIFNARFSAFSACLRFSCNRASRSDFAAASSVLLSTTA